MITDSSACLPPLASRDLEVLPIRIHLPTRDVDDTDPRAATLVYGWLERGEPVKSSAPTPLDYLSAVERVNAEAAVIVTPATEFTTMYRSAMVAGDLASRRTAVVDSRTAAAAHGLVVAAATEAAEAYGSVDEVVAAANEAARRADLVATLESLEFIRRSGRVMQTALGLVDRLGLHPVFRLRDGQVRRLGVSRTAEASIRRIRREWEAGGGDARPLVFHAARPGRARELTSVLGPTSGVVEFSPSMGIHTGPGLVGAAWLRGT